MQAFDKSSTAFVLNMDAGGLGVARSLGRLGIPVIGIDFQRDAAGMHSRYSRSIRVDDPRVSPDAVLQVLLEEGKKLGHKGILYPTADTFLLLVSRHRKQLEEFYRLALPPDPVLEGIVNKRLQYESARAAGVPIADTYYPASIGEVEAIKKDLGYPVFLKPYFSHLWQAKFDNKGFVAANEAELDYRYRMALESGLEVMIQSVIPGPNTNHVKVCAYFGANGEPLALFQTQKIRQYPTDFGVGTLMRTVHNAEVLELGFRFFRSLGYRGPGSIEFKKDDRDGTFKMIELNARLWAQNIQATFAGVNFALVQYLELTGQPVPAATEFREGVRWFEAIQDFQAAMKYWREGKLGLVAWLKSWLGSDCYAYFAWDDPVPGWRNSEFGLKYLRLPLYLLHTWMLVDLM